MFSLFRGRRAEANQQLIEGLHAQIVAAARQPAFYLDYGVADTFEGRFELMIVLAGIALSRLNAAEAPGPAVAQDLVDAIFRHLDSGLREMGVGDLAVPKRIKRLAGAFLGRSSAYDAASRAGEAALAMALSRNMFDEKDDGRHMARYVSVARTRFADHTLDACLRQSLPFPDPASIV